MISRWITIYSCVLDINHNKLICAEICDSQFRRVSFSCGCRQVGCFPLLQTCFKSVNKTRCYLSAIIKQTETVYEVCDLEIANLINCMRISVRLVSVATSLLV